MRKKLFPHEVLGDNDSVGQVSVTNLMDNEQQFMVTDVFHPSFFWIRQFSKLTPFNSMMENLE